MRKIFYVLAVLCFCTACQQKAGYTINGKVDGIADGDTVYLQDFMNRQLVKLDSAIVKNGTFKFTGNQESPVYRYITYIKGFDGTIFSIYKKIRNFHHCLGYVPEFHFFIL